MHGERAFQETVPGLEDAGRQGLQPAHQPPAGSAHEHRGAFLRNGGGIAFAGGEADHERAERFRSLRIDAEEGRRLPVELRADEPAGDAPQVGRLGRAENLGQPRQAGRMYSMA